MTPLKYAIKKYKRDTLIILKMTQQIYCPKLAAKISKVKTIRPPIITQNPKLVNDKYNLSNI